VVPTAHNVVLRYGSTPANKAGDILSVLGLVGLLAALIVPLIWRGRRRGGAWRQTTATPAP
jgi:hypothetical protein